MMTLFALLFLKLSIFFEQELKTNQYDSLIIESIVRGDYSFGSRNDFHKCLLVDIYIRNSGPKSIKIWTSSCSYNDNFILPVEKYSIIFNNCSANYPILIELRPNQKYNVPLLIEGKQWSDFKVGFTVIYEDQYNMMLDYFKILENHKMNQKQIIWGIIKVTPRFQKTYEIM